MAANKCNTLNQLAEMKNGKKYSPEAMTRALSCAAIL